MNCYIIALGIYHLAISMLVWQHSSLFNSCRNDRRVWDCKTRFISIHHYGSACQTLGLKGTKSGSPRLSATKCMGFPVTFSLATPPVCSALFCYVMFFFRRFCSIMFCLVPFYSMLCSFLFCCIVVRAVILCFDSLLLRSFLFYYALFYSIIFYKGSFLCCYFPFGSVL
jgi:hypothetical protein